MSIVQNAICVEMHPTKCDRVHLVQESAEGAIANVASIGGDRNANTVSQKNDYDQGNKL